MATKSLVSATATRGIKKRRGGQGREAPGIPGCHPRSRPHVPRLLPPPLAAAASALWRLLVPPRGRCQPVSTHPLGAKVGDPRWPRILRRQPHGRTQRAGTIMVAVPEVFERAQQRRQGKPRLSGGRHNLGTRREDRRAKGRAQRGAGVLTGTPHPRLPTRVTPVLV